MQHISSVTEMLVEDRNRKGIEGAAHWYMNIIREEVTRQLITTTHEQRCVYTWQLG